MASLSKHTRLIGAGFAMGESPRWRDGKLWLSDWGAGEIVALVEEGRRVETLAVPFQLPFCFDWSAEGSMLIVAGREAHIVRREPDGSLKTFVDLSAVSAGPWNEIVVDRRGNAYINALDAIALVTPSGAVRRVADGGQFPNGMAVTPDNQTLLVAESHGKRITAFDIAPDGGLGNRRTWAELRGHPDGVCLDSEGALWCADVPNKTCVRVKEGGAVLDHVEIDRGCFSCALGGRAGKTLFIVATEWRGMDKIAEVSAARTGQVLAVEVPVGAAD